MLHLLIGLVLLTEPALAPRVVQGRPTYRLTLRPDRRDYQLISPTTPGPYAVVVAGTCAKCKLVFATPLPAGRYQLEVQIGDPDATVVFSVPMATGASRFVVTARGRARHDFAFHHATSAKEYRFTFTGPMQKTFDLHFP